LESCANKTVVLESIVTSLFGEDKKVTFFYIIEISDP